MRFIFWRSCTRFVAHSNFTPHICRYSAAAASVNAKQAPAKFSKKRQIRISNFLRSMTTPEIEELAPLRSAVKKQGDLVRQLKSDSSTAKNDIDRAVHELKAAKKRLEDKELELTPKHMFVDRLKLEDLLKRRFFYDQAFAIYGGVSGLYDFGPMGCALKSNLVQFWRQHFVLEDSMLEVECSALTPEDVLTTSGHTERFIDWMVKDAKTGECFRADHLIKNAIEDALKEKTNEATKQEFSTILARLDGFSSNEMHDVIVRYGFKSPITKNDLTEPVAFNLMFPTQIGPTGEFRAFLRPETAQGIFLNFKRLLEFNQGHLPFAATQIGPGFRNEISPRQGLLRVREFTMAEIEHFVDPKDKSCAKFARYADMKVLLFSARDQEEGKAASWQKLGDALKAGTIDNETLAYYMARTHLYLTMVGVDVERLRFRQHLANEMAHYAQDCWDAECLTTYGWIECVGHADRSCYDLTAHARRTRQRLTVNKKLPTPIHETVVSVLPNKAVFGKHFRTDEKLISNKLDNLSMEEKESIEKALSADSSYTLQITTEDGSTKDVQLNKAVISVKRSEKKRETEEITPSVVEPSFGIGRIMYVVLEHAFRLREGDAQRNWLELPALVAPVKCSILPMSSDKHLASIVRNVREHLVEAGISYKVDDSSGSIGRRYARTDEIGIPFGVTVDKDSKDEPHTVTLRHTPTMEQVRLKIEEVGPTIKNLVAGKDTWQTIADRFPRFIASAES